MNRTISLYGTPCGGCGRPALGMVLFDDVHVVRHARTGDIPCRFPVATPPSDRILPPLRYMTGRPITDVHLPAGAS